MRLNFASVIELLADRLVDQPCIYYGDRAISWQDYEGRASRVAKVISDHGLTKDSKVGLFLYNCTEYMESMLAAYKCRAIPININYRYVGEELVYLLNDCEAEALIFHSSLANRVVEIKERLPRLKLLISVDDGGESSEEAISYESIIEEVQPMARIERSSDDILMLYTGGTTGMPKGVEFKIGDMLAQMIEYAPMFFGIPKAQSLDDLLEQSVQRAKENKSLVSLPASPLMHTAGILNSGFMVQLHGGAMVILKSRSFDPRELWRAVEKFHVNHMVVVGDTFVRPMLDALEEDKAKGIEYDLSSLTAMMSSGVIFSQESKIKLLELADMMILDGVGATEGAIGAQISTRANPPTATAHFIAFPTTQIFDEEDKIVPCSSGQVGLIGMSGTLPQGYYKDPEKTARTFKVIDGVRWGFTGDMGTIDAEGTLHFMGRGSNCINTGGEKVYPEEVEEVIKRHPQVVDCLVAGLPDKRFGQRVAAVVSLRQPMADPTAELMEFASQSLARYKLPRTVKVAERVHRAPNGKADYIWAKNFLRDQTC